MIVDLPPAFYWDRLSRDLPTGTLVRELSRSVRVELSLVEVLDVQSDAGYYADGGIASEMIGEDAGAIGLVSSARATLKKVDALLAEIPADEIERARREEREAWEAGAEERAAHAARVQEAADRQAAEMAAEREAHPRVQVVYVVHRPVSIFGLKTDDDLKVGTILVTPNLVKYEIVELGDEHRGDFAATLRNPDGVELAAKIEVAMITNRKEQ